MVYCFIRWVTFLGVFKKRESLCLFAGSFKTVSPTPLATPSFRVDVHRPFSLRQGNETFHGKFERKPIPTLNVSTRLGPIFSSLCYDQAPVRKDSRLFNF